MSARNTATILVGIQWGDEGKGRVVDLYARDADIVARFGGGDNAGHTLVVGDRKLALRIVPSGALVASTQLFIGGGTVVSLVGLIAELDSLANIGVDTARIMISDRAHVVFPYHAAADRASEAARGKAAIGTTGRGIGPAYIDKAARNGITFRDLANPQALADKIRFNLSARAESLRGADLPTEEEIIATALEQARRIAPHVIDGVEFMHTALEGGKRVLIEGAQGTMLDVGYGTYPFVTSSHTIAGGATTGLGIGPTAIGRVVGIAKAYCTRVGAGPFPSELTDEIGQRLQTAGAEFGVVTGRPRRCGWFDAVAARYAVRLNGLSSVVVTKLDVLSGFERIGVVVGYRSGGVLAGISAIDDPVLEPVVEWHEGWAQDISAVRERSALPPAARRYIDALEAVMRVPVEGISVGPEREQFVR